jgi:hypothetical protein
MKLKLRRRIVVVAVGSSHWVQEGVDKVVSLPVVML